MHAAWYQPCTPKGLPAVLSPPALAVVAAALAWPLGVECARLEEVDQRCVPAVPCAGVAAQRYHAACVAFKVPPSQTSCTLDHVLHLVDIHSAAAAIHSAGTANSSECVLLVLIMACI